MPRENPELIIESAPDAAVDANGNPIVEENGNPSDALVITRTGPTDEPLTVTLSSDDEGEATVPTTVTIPAGETSVIVPVTPVDDDIIDGTQYPTITASAPGFDPVTQDVTVLDDDVPELTIEPAPDAAVDANGNPVVIENGSPSDALVITRTGPTDQPLTVTLNSDDEGEATVPTTVTIPAGETSVIVPVTPVDDDIIDGTQYPTITASAPGFDPVTQDVAVLDDDVPELTIEPAPGAEIDANGNPVVVENGSPSDALLISRTGPTDEPLTVTLSSDDEGEATVPTTVTIPAGETSVVVPVTPVDDDIIDGTQYPTITASAPGFDPVTQDVAVLDDDVDNGGCNFDFFDCTDLPVVTNFTQEFYDNVGYYTGTQGNDAVRIHGDLRSATMIYGDNYLEVEDNVNVASFGSGNDVLQVGGDLNRANLYTGDNVAHIEGNAESITAFGGDDCVKVDGDLLAANLHEGENQLVVDGDVQVATFGNSNDALKVGGDLDRASLFDGDNVAHIEGNAETITAMNGDDCVKVDGDLNAAYLYHGDNYLEVGGDARVATFGYGDDVLKVGDDLYRATLFGGNDTAIVLGDSGTITAVAGDNRVAVGHKTGSITFGAGDDILAVDNIKNGVYANGGSGNDRLILIGDASEYNIESTYSGLRITDSQGDSMTARCFESVEFTDQTLDFDFFDTIA
ncbi:MAG: hypothetical protein ABW124_20635 [Candidatus Thiodiazotropha sp. 6PLUC9]